MYELTVPVRRTIASGRFSSEFLYPVGSRRLSLLGRTESAILCLGPCKARSVYPYSTGITSNSHSFISTELQSTGAKSMEGFASRAPS